MKALIIGASGLVGGNFLKRFRENDSFEVIGTHKSYSTDDTVYFDPNELSKRRNFDYGRFKPDVIVHCGAMTHVDGCEENPDTSYARTVESAENVAKIAEMFNSKLIYISSDYVFDGDDGPYDEKAKPNPQSVYGEHKLEAENKIKSITRNHLILRITNVYGDEIRNKNFIARLIKNVEENKKQDLKLPYDQFATPINASDVARAALRLVNANQRGIYHLASTDYLNRYQLANKILSYFPGNRLTVTPETSDALNQPARRPLQGGLKCKKFVNEFPDFYFYGVDAYMLNVVLPRQRRRLE